MLGFVGREVEIGEEPGDKAVATGGNRPQVVGSVERGSVGTEIDEVAGEVVVDVGVFDEILEFDAVDRDATERGCVQLQVGGDVVEQLWGESVHFEKLFRRMESSEAFAVADDAACECGSDAVE